MQPNDIYLVLKPSQLRKMKSLLRPVNLVLDFYLKTRGRWKSIPFDRGE